MILFVVGVAALVVQIVGLVVAWPVLFERSYVWERVDWMRAERNLVTGEIVTDFEKMRLL